MAVMAAVLFAAVYVLPVAGAVVGVVLLKKKPAHRKIGLTILVMSLAVCALVAIWKTIDIINFQ
jgi:hypothetical protein